MAVGRFFFSAALHAQNSPELHFRFINSFIQPSLLESVLESLSITNHFDVHFLCQQHKKGNIKDVT